jgi:hypothetical protein
VDPTGGNVNVEMGGSSGGGMYGASTGAASFPNRAWIAVAGGDDPNKTNFGGKTDSTSGGGGGSLGTSSGGGGGQDASSLASTAISGLLQSSGLDGSVFSDPTQWPNIKSGLAGLNWLGGVLGNRKKKEKADDGTDSTDLSSTDSSSDSSSDSSKSDFGTDFLGGLLDDLGLGNFKDLLPKPPKGAGLAGNDDVAGLQPKDDGAMATSTARPDEAHQGTGAAPGPLVQYNGTVNMGVDPRAMTQRQDAHMNQAYRKNMSAVRPG